MNNNILKINNLQDLQKRKRILKKKIAYKERYFQNRVETIQAPMQSLASIGNFVGQNFPKLSLTFSVAFSIFKIIKGIRKKRETKG